MKLFFRYAGILFRCQIQYKRSFLMTLAGQFLTAFTGFLSIYFLFLRFSGVEGFTYQEVLLCYGVVLSAFALAECFVRGFDSFHHMIANSEFDRILVRPQGLILQVLGSRMDFTRAGRLVQALGALGFAILTGDVPWTWDKALTLLLMLTGGFFTFSGIFVIYASLCFFTIEGLEFMNILTYGSQEFGRYPFAVYGKTVLQFLTYVVPLALFQYYPLLYVLGRSDSLLYMLCPLLGLLFLIPCLALWRFGVRHYKSTGS